jgi:exodeoxyribonuclease-5
MILTDEQNIAKDKLIEFINSKPTEKEDYIYTLSGFAGTGKTTIMNTIIQEVKYNVKLAVSAPTHKAKEVISKMTGQNGETLQALLGLKPNIALEDFNPNKPIFEVQGEQRIGAYKLVIIDEASMINKKLAELLEDTAFNHKTKIIYTGDEYQLPPVGEVLSTTFKHKNIVHLTEIVRQSNSNPNQKLIELARNDVRDKTDTCLEYLKTINTDLNGNEGFKLLDKDTYYNSLLEKYYDSEYQQNPDIIKTLAWTNIAVTSINKYIRKNVIKSEEAIAVGEILMGYKSIGKDIDAPPFYVPIVKNSVDYIVTKCDLLEKRIMHNTYKGYVVEVKDGKTPMFILHQDSYEDFRIEMHARHTKAKQFRQWKQYYDFKNQIILLETIVFGSAIDQKCDKDIDYGYAITVHKCQGSTYKNVGITLTDILKNKTPQERRQLIYVAISRTSELNLLYM